mgnify:CR=1 FL=1
MYDAKPWTQHYEKGVPTTIDIPSLPVHQFLVDAAAKHPDKVAVRMVLKYLPFGLAVQAKMTYRELNRQSDQFAAALAQLGVVKGSRVSIMLPNLPQQVIAYFGILKAGGVVVNTNPTYPAHELEPLMRASEVETIITVSGLYDRVLEIQPKTSIKNIILTDIPDYIGGLFRRSVARQVRTTGMLKDVTLKPGAYRFSDLLAQAPAKAPALTFDTGKDTAVFQFTGGTTGLPKAAELTHRNLMANTAQMLAWMPGLRRGQEKLLLALPAFHVYGMTVGMLLCVSIGSELVIVPDPRNTSHILEVIAHEHITLYPGVPAMYIALINHPKVADYNLRSITACLSGGSALPVEVAQKFEEITGGKKCPVVYDSVGKDTFLKSLDCLAPLGVAALFGQSSGAVEPLNLGLLAAKGSLYVTRPTLFTYAARRESLVAMANELFDVVKSGAVKIEVHQTYPLKDAAKAHTDLAARKTTGSTVFLV